MTESGVNNAEQLDSDDSNHRKPSSINHGPLAGVGVETTSEEVIIARDDILEHSIAEIGGGKKTASEVVDSEPIREDYDDMRLIRESAVMESEEVVGMPESSDVIEEEEEEDGTTDYDVEMVLAKQNTHDLFCPNCHSCITRRVILQRRKRKVRFKQRKKKPTASGILDAPISEISSSDNVSPEENDRDKNDSLFRCLSCFTFFIPSGSVFKFFGHSKSQQEGKNEQEAFYSNNLFFSMFSPEGRNTRKKTNTVIPSADKTKEHGEITEASLSASKTYFVTSATMASDSPKATPIDGDMQLSSNNVFGESSVSGTGVPEIGQAGAMQSAQGPSASAVFDEESDPLVTSKPSMSSSKRQEGSLLSEIGKRMSKVKDSIRSLSTSGKESIVDSSDVQVSSHYYATDAEEPFLLDAERRKLISESEFEEPFSPQQANRVVSSPGFVSSVYTQQDISISSEEPREISKIDDAMQGLSEKGREKVMDFFNFLVSSKHPINEDNQIAMLGDGRKKPIVDKRKGPLKIADVAQFLLTSENKTANGSSSLQSSAADNGTVEDEHEQISLLDGRRMKPKIETFVQEESAISVFTVQDDSSAISGGEKYVAKEDDGGLGKPSIKGSSDGKRTVSKVEDAVQVSERDELPIEHLSIYVSYPGYVTDEDEQVFSQQPVFDSSLVDDRKTASSTQQDVPISSERTEESAVVSSGNHVIKESEEMDLLEKDKTMSDTGSGFHSKGSKEVTDISDSQRSSPRDSSKADENIHVLDEGKMEPVILRSMQKDFPIDFHVSSFDDGANKDEQLVAIYEEGGKKPLVAIPKAEDETSLDEEGSKQDTSSINDLKRSTSGSKKAVDSFSLQASSPYLVGKEDEQTALLNASEEFGAQHYNYFADQIGKGVLKIEDVIKILSTPNLEKMPMIESALDSKDAAALSTPLLDKSGDLLFPSSASIKYPTSKLAVNSDEIQLSDGPESLTQKIPVSQSYQPGARDSQNVVIVVEPESRSAKQMQPEETTEVSLTSCIVYGGLVEAITSLGVISSAAGAGSSTAGVFGLGLANLIGGFFVLCHNLLDLRHDHKTEDSEQESAHNRYMVLRALRKSFVLYASVIALSYVVFGALPPVIYGFSFHKSDDRDFKFLAVAVVSVFCVGLLAAARAYAIGQKNYFSNMIYFVALAFGSCGSSFVLGDLFVRLLQHFGWSQLSAVPLQRGWSSF